ncbi:hypothetical protein PYCCODRAFT_1095325 [Trametes coccinea BRFM310]|uniref:Uncharacterized protein n=1 Tax=Trametes coccinea (strain BRFM310) TaxID=1353009 RepID=A0A1Y2IYS6_TRAC3|nr:hypothetical protein PYCCODRAFT_1095325 [Trametes coccinea BRFM310]
MFACVFEGLSSTRCQSNPDTTVGRHDVPEHRNRLEVRSACCVSVSCARPLACVSPKPHRIVRARSPESDDHLVRLTPSRSSNPMICTHLSNPQQLRVVVLEQRFPHRALSLVRLLSGRDLAVPVRNGDRARRWLTRRRSLSLASGRLLELLLLLRKRPLLHLRLERLRVPRQYLVLLQLGQPLVLLGLSEGIGRWDEILQLFVVVVIVVVLLVAFAFRRYLPSF